MTVHCVEQLFMSELYILHSIAVQYASDNILVVPDTLIGELATDDVIGPGIPESESRQDKEKAVNKGFHAYNLAVG